MQRLAASCSLQQQGQQRHGDEAEVVTAGEGDAVTALLSATDRVKDEEDVDDEEGANEMKTSQRFESTGYWTHLVPSISLSSRRYCGLDFMLDDSSRVQAEEGGDGEEEEYDHGGRAERVPSHQTLRSAEPKLLLYCGLGLVSDGSVYQISTDRTYRESWLAQSQLPPTDAAYRQHCSTTSSLRMGPYLMKLPNDPLSVRLNVRILFL